MLIEKLAGLVAVRRRTVALRLGCAVGEPPFGGVAFSFVAGGAFARDPEVDDLSHERARRLPNARSGASSADAEINPRQMRRYGGGVRFRREALIRMLLML